MTIVLPTKSDITFSLQSYQGLKTDISLGDLSIPVSPSGVYKLVFYLTILNKYYVTATLGRQDSSWNIQLSTAHNIDAIQTVKFPTCDPAREILKLIRNASNKRPC